MNIQKMHPSLRLFLYPMQQWHLYEFKNGQLVAGRLTVCLVVWYHRRFCVAACLHQFHEP